VVKATMLGLSQMRDVRSAVASRRARAVAEV
jgi:hypothetical protein